MAQSGRAANFLRALDSIEGEIREVPDVVFVEMSLTRGRINDHPGKAFEHLYRYVMLLASRSILAHWESLCFDIGGLEFPFVWSPKKSEVYESFPQDLVNEREPVEFAVWYYLDSWRCTIPQHALDMWPPDEDFPDPEEGIAAFAYQAEMDRVRNVMRSLKTAWSLAPEAVVCEFGDLSRLPTGPTLPWGTGDDFDLWWPAVLLYLALQKADVVLSASADAYIPWDSIFDDLPEGGDHQARIDAFVPDTWTVSLNPPGLMAATRCALRAFRRVAEDSTKTPGPVTAGAPTIRWNKDRCELTIDGEIVRKLRGRTVAKNAVMVLDCFENDGWPDRIDSPFPSDESGMQTCRETIRSLNAGLLRIRFAADGSGEGILWQLAE